MTAPQKAEIKYILLIEETLYLLKFAFNKLLIDKQITWI
jgi:hypothetical protein